ncbi:hypothetical protein QL285_033329 [Trifolium repens]|nr:hypothetical protein QL285_033329 [Trifolium repens]
MDTTNGNNNNGGSNPVTVSSVSEVIVSPVISEIVPNASGATVSAPTSSVVSATMTMPTSVVVPSTTTEPILTFSHTMERNFSPNRSDVNGGGVGSSTFALPFSQYIAQGSSRNYPYGMPTTMMQGLQTSPSLFTESAPGVFVPNNQIVSGSATRSGNPTLTNNALNALRQQMDESNHDMVNMLTQQIGIVFNPLIQNTNQSYQLLANQMGRIADFFGAPQVPNQQVPQIQNVVPLQIAQAPDNAILPAPNNVVNPIHQIQQQVPVVEPQVQIQAQQQALPQVEQNPGIVLVNRNQNADDVVRNVQNNNFAGQNNIANLVETILAQNGLNIGMHRPHFVSALSEYVLQTELPRGWKIPKFTKFAGDTSESTVEHIARYLTEAGDLANNENLRMKYFPNSLTKNAFTWFTTLPPQSIFNWNQLERVFHEQFYMGQSKISLKELASVRRKTPESVDDYLNRFRLLKARCFTQVPEHELVEMAAGGLDYSIRKKLDTQHLRDMAQLADRVRQVERLRAEKARNSKYHKNEKVAYVETHDSDQEYDISYENVEQGEIDLAELKPGPPYTCKLLKPSNGKNPVEPKNDKYVSKTYTFDITKCDEIFDLLVTYGQIVVPKGVKVPPLEMRKKRGYCKYHNFLGHRTSQCVLFRDLVQKALNEGRLKFGEKPKVAKGDPESSHNADTLYAEPQAIMMVEAMEVTEVQVEKIPEEEYFEKMKVVYPRAEEDLIDFLNRCKLENKGVMLCARCSAVCDKEATAGLMKFQPVANRQGANSKPPRDKGKGILARPNSMVQTDRRPTFLPSGSIPIERWMHQGTIKFNKGAMEVGGSSGTKLSYSEDANKYSYRNNYKGKHPMTRTQWRRFQRQKKLAATNLQTGQYKEVARRPAKERILPPINENKMEDEDLLDSEPDFDVICVVSILPSEYDVQTEITELETDFDQLEMADPKPICYYVMNNGCIEEQQATFERPDLGMKNHLKPLFIRAKVEGVGINKVLIDGGAAVNLMPLSMLPKIGKYDCDLSAHNIVLSNYEGKTGHSRGAIQVDVAVGSIVRPTLFLVVESKANFNLLLGREWIHGVGAVPSTLHQKLILWREDGCVENIEADQSFYMSEVDTINQQTFDKNLANIAPCYDRENAFTPSDNVIHSVKLHPTQGFIWEREEIDAVSSEDGVAPPSG